LSKPHYGFVIKSVLASSKFMSKMRTWSSTI